MTTQLFSLNLSSTKRLLICLSKEHLILQELTSYIHNNSTYSVPNEIHIPISQLKTLIQCINKVVKLLSLL